MLILRRVPRRGIRLSAGVAAAETTTALAIAHTAAGGEVPSAGWLLVVAATAYGAGMLVLRHKAPIRVVLPALVGLQVLLHAWLVALSTAPATDHTHATGSDALLGLTGPMLLAHVTAGAVAALAWALRRRAVDVLLAWIDPERPSAPLLRTSPVPHLLRPGTTRDLDVAPTRGPPALLSATA